MVTVQDILGKKSDFVAYVSLKDSVLETTKEMNRRRIGAVVVVDDEKVVGIFSERDVLTRVVAAQADPESTTVGQVMTSPVACCVPETAVEECKAVMTEKRIRHLPVVKEGKLLGIVTSGDIMAFEKGQHKETIKYLKEYIYGPYPIEDKEH